MKHNAQTIHVLQNSENKGFFIFRMAPGNNLPKIFALDKNNLHHAYKNGKYSLSQFHNILKRSPEGKTAKLASKSMIMPTFHKERS